MNELSSYVCAFRGARDSYQVPLALAEGGMLDQFITDFYCAPLARIGAAALPGRWREKLLAREEKGIPTDRVRRLLGLFLRENLRHLLGFSRALTIGRLDAEFSLAAASRVRRSRADLFLYSPYAWEAFTARYAHEPRKVLFQFHPHPACERRILLADRKNYPFAARAPCDENGNPWLEPVDRRLSECWRYADAILCASSFTRRSLVEAGAPAERCRVVPYGVASATDNGSCPKTFEALFVGNGTQRKGLHHLLLAWRKANLPSSSRLTLVCRQIDPGILDLARQRADIRLVRGAASADLVSLYKASSVLLLPSLVEGFGLVYLEALAQGCPVLGTANTGLPDLGESGGAVKEIEPGNVDELVSQLECLARELPGNEAMRERARALARAWSWPRFRQGIRKALFSSAGEGSSPSLPFACGAKGSVAQGEGR